MKYPIPLKMIEEAKKKRYKRYGLPVILSGNIVDGFTVNQSYKDTVTGKGETRVEEVCLAKLYNYVADKQVQETTDEITKGTKAWMGDRTM